MNSFLRSVRLIGSNRDQIIKESLIANLSENIREIQFEYNELKNKMGKYRFIHILAFVMDICCP